MEVLEAHTSSWTLLDFAPPDRQILFRSKCPKVNLRPSNLSLKRFTADIRPSVTTMHAFGAVIPHRSGHVGRHAPRKGYQVRLATVPSTCRWERSRPCCDITRQTPLLYTSRSSAARLLILILELLSLVISTPRPASSPRPKILERPTYIDFTMRLTASLGYFALLWTGVLSQSDDAIKAVAMINQARQTKGLQPLAWHPDLATYAQFWAERMGSNQEPFHHASGQLRPSQGETLYQEQSTQCDPAYDTPLQSAVNDWLGQALLYTGQPITTGQEPWLHFCKTCVEL